MTQELETKVKQALKLLQSCSRSAGKPLEIAYSGGKDSDVILELAKMAGISYRAIYKNTTIDPPGTIKHVKENGVEIRRPAKNFFQLMAEHGYPNKNYRFCCNILKEYKISDNVVMGIRRCESTKRKNRYSEPTACRFYGSKKNHANAIYPILFWTDEDELEFIEARGIKLHPLYYREDGTIDITRRLGCMCCPLRSTNKRLEDFRERPKMFNIWLKIGWGYLATHPTGEPAKKYGDVYEWLYSELFYKAWKNWKTGFFKDEKIDFKQLLYNKLNKVSRQNRRHAGGNKRSGTKSVTWRTYATHAHASSQSIHRGGGKK